MGVKIYDTLFKWKAKGNAYIIDEKFYDAELKPTEYISMKPTHRYRDTVFELDNKYYNFEYQTGKITLKDLRRFNLYHAMLIDEYQTEYAYITIIYTEKVDENTVYETEQSSFKPKIFSLKSLNGDEILNKIKSKIENNEKLTKKEETHLSQLPLYESKRNEKDLLYEVCKITNQTQGIDQEELDYIKISQVMLVEKLITNPKEKEKYMEAIGMETSPTIDRIINQGIEQGREEGIEEGSKNTKFDITKNMLKRNIPINDIVEITGLSKEEIKNIQ